ncbi:hypothetical protein KAU08_00805 [bacterium]|nr:hypothetical protein [bacterium]
MAEEIAERLLMLNPLYWLFELGTGMFGNMPPRIHILNMTMGAAGWGIISFMIAEIPARKQGRFVLWYFTTLVFGVIPYLLYWFFDEYLGGKKRTRKVMGRKLISTDMKVSDLVGSAVNVFSPRQLREFEIQDLVDANKFYEAIRSADAKLRVFQEKRDFEAAEKYENLLGWIKHAQKRYDEENRILD